MLSIPPATMTSLALAMSRSCASIAAFIPEPHILFTVVAAADKGRPAPSDAWRAGACPCPAGSTQPMITSCTWSGLTPARSIAARIAAAPSCGAVKSFSSPCSAPIGVRAAETITIESLAMTTSKNVLSGCAPSESVAEAQGLRIREHVFDMAGGDALLDRGPVIGVEQVGVVFEEYLAHPLVAQQE